MSGKQLIQTSEAAKFEHEITSIKRQMAVIDLEYQQVNSKLSELSMDCKTMVMQMESLLSDESSSYNITMGFKSSIQAFKQKHFTDIVNVNSSGNETSLTDLSLAKEMTSNNSYYSVNKIIQGDDDSNGYEGEIANNNHIEIGTIVNVKNTSDCGNSESNFNETKSMTDLPVYKKVLPSKYGSGADIRNRQFSCGEIDCGRRFTRTADLRRHMRTHDRLKPFICDHENCGKRFGLSFNLLRHKRHHTDNKKTYVCEQDGCGRQFLRLHYLKRHQCIHSKEVLFAYGNANYRNTVSMNSINPQQEQQFNSTYEISVMQDIPSFEHNSLFSL